MCAARFAFIKARCPCAIGTSIFYSLSLGLMLLRFFLALQLSVYHLYLSVYHDNARRIACITVCSHICILIM